MSPSEVYLRKIKKYTLALTLGADRITNGSTRSILKKERLPEISGQTCDVKPGHIEDCQTFLLLIIRHHSLFSFS